MERPIDMAVFPFVALTNVYQLKITAFIQPAFQLLDRQQLHGAGIADGVAVAVLQFSDIMIAGLRLEGKDLVGIIEQLNGKQLISQRLPIPVITFTASEAW